MGTLSQAKTLGGVGSILVLLTIIPTAGPVIAIIGFILTLIAVKYISDYLQDSSIFNDMLIGIVLSIVGFVAIGVIVAASVYRFIGLEKATSSTISSTPGFGSLLGEIAVGLVIGWIVLVISAYFFRKSYNIIGTKLNVGMFRTAALVYFIGAILSIVLVGLLLILIAQILLIIAFFSIPETPMAYNPIPPSPGSPVMSTGTTTATKFCVKCGASIPADVAFCPNCGASQVATS